MDYAAFLAGKRLLDPPTGIPQPPAISNALFPFQADIVRWALRRGRAAVFAGTGLGKTLIELAWGDAVHRATGGDILHLTPLAVAAQVIREAEKFGIPARQVRDQSECGPGINVTNYQKLPHFDPSRFAAVILDECFAPDTPIDVIDEAGSVSQKDIENIRIGDRILNAAGIDTVSDVHRREVPYAIRVRYAGRSVIASPNHPFLTSRGWVAAQDLEPGDALVGSAEAVRVLRRDVHGAVCPSLQDTLLRAILLSEMADEATGALGEGAYAGGRGEARREAQSSPRQRYASGTRRDRADYGAQPYVEAGSQSQGLPPIERDRAQTFRAWGQWSGADATAIAADGCAARQMEGGICLVTGPADGWVSDALQDRLSERRAASRYRGGWAISSVAQELGCQKGCDADFYGVDGIEVLEPGHPELDQYRDADGKLYFYDLGGTRHPSFSIYGALVHNSSILKSTDGHYRTRLIRDCASVPFRLAATATPAPNDFMELGNHAEFLGVMSYTDMLATFFVHDGGDTQKWRLKGHAEADFWRWLASFSVMLRRPSDLGYEDGAYALPPLFQHQHTVSADHDPATAGTLFPVQARTMRERLTVRRDTIAERVSMAASLTPADRPFVWWCNLNAESEALARALPGFIELRGSRSESDKERIILDFVEGRTRGLITKPSLAGFGLNFQHCADTGFVGLNDSWEQIYQAVRRFWRYGQRNPVNAHFIADEREGAVVANLRRKDADAERMADAMVAHMADLGAAAIRGSERVRPDYAPARPLTLPAWLGAAA